MIVYSRFDERGYREAAFRFDLFELVRPTVVINGVDTGVKDVIIGGKNLSVWIAEAIAAASGNHGRAVAAVTQIASQAHKAELITEREKAILTTALAKKTHSAP